MWFFEFLLGMFLAYMIMSPRLRHLLFRRNHTPPIQIQNKTRNGHEVEVEDGKIQEWMSKNPDLRKVNRRG